MNFKELAHRKLIIQVLQDGPVALGDVVDKVDKLQPGINKGDIKELILPLISRGEVGLTNNRYLYIIKKVELE